MNEHYPRFRRYSLFDGEKYLCIRECVRISFYMRRDHLESVPAVMRSLDLYLRTVGSQALGWYLDHEGEWLSLKGPGWDVIRQWMHHPRGANVTLIGDPENASGFRFTYYGIPLDAPPPVGGPARTCEVTFWLPTEYLEEHGPQRVRELALELGTALPFDSGHAGLTYLFPEGLLGITRPIREVCFRYPGIDLADSDVRDDLGTRVQGAHWLTFLGPPVLQALGGTTSLRERLHSPATTVQTLDDERAVVTLGPWPEAGDVEEGRTLPEYRELARVLEPWLYERHSVWDGFSRDDMTRWNRRFLD